MLDELEEVDDYTTAVPPMICVNAYHTDHMCQNCGSPVIVRVESGYVGFSCRDCLFSDPLGKLKKVNVTETEPITGPRCNRDDCVAEADRYVRENHFTPHEGVEYEVYEAVNECDDGHYDVVERANDKRRLKFADGRPAVLSVDEDGGDDDGKDEDNGPYIRIS